MLAADGAKVTSLAVSHAFHSPLMAPAQAAFRDIAAAVTPRKAKVPLVSTMHGRLVDGTEMDADYWAAQLTATVRFVDAIATGTTLATPTHLVELGPRSTLLALARRCGVAPPTVTLAPCVGPDDDGAGFARVAARLYTDGLTTRFDTLYRDESRADGTRFWRTLDTAPTAESAAAPSGRVNASRVADPHPEPDTDTATPRDTIAAKVRYLIADIGGYTTEAIDPNALLGEDLGFDSLLQVRLIDRLRTEYPQLENAPVDELVLVVNSIADLVHYVTYRIACTETPA
jgi:acyl transferase domain-containing protein